jgi:hypothetical protein
MIPNEVRDAGNPASTERRRHSCLRSWASLGFPFLVPHPGFGKGRSWGNSGRTPDDELSLEAGTRRDFTDLSIFEYVAAQILFGGLQHRPAQVLAIDVKSGKWF